MRKWSGLIIATALSLFLAACGSSTEAPGDPGNPGEPGDPGTPGNPGVDTCSVVITDDITVMQTWENSASECDYYLADSVRLMTRLTIEPGTTIYAADGAQLVIDDAGMINAVGTETERIRFIGRSGVPGSWYGICFTGNQLETTLDYVDILWAGGAPSPGFRYCRAAIGSRYKGGGVVNITNSRVIGALTTGIDATEFTLGEFSNNVLAGNLEYGLRVSAANLPKLDHGTNYSGVGVRFEGSDEDLPNARQYVYLDTLPVVDNGEVQLWKNLGLPYYLERDDGTYTTSSLWIEENALVEVEAGTEFVMGPGNMLIGVEWGAALGLFGEPGNEIVFTSEANSAGAWEGIWLYGGVIFADHVIFENGGEPDYFGEDAIVTFRRVDGPFYCSDIRNSTFRNSASSGVSIDEYHSDWVYLDMATLEFENMADENVIGTPNGPAILDDEPCGPTGA